MALERPKHRGAFDDYERRQVRLYDALSTLRPGDAVRFATVQKTWSEIVEVTVTGTRAEARVAAPRSDREYLLWVDRGAGERGIHSRKSGEKFRTHTAEFNWVAVDYQDRDGQITVGYVDKMKGTDRARKAKR